MTNLVMESNSSINLVNYLQNETTVVNSTRPYVLPLWQQLVWSLVFGIMVIIAVIGNLMIMWIIIAHRRMRMVTNYFLLNLSVADFMTVTFNAIFNFIYMLDSHWPFGTPYCVFNHFLAYTTVATSVFTMMVMSIDRYMATVWPLTPRLSRNTVRFIIAAIWSFAALLSFPTLLYATTVTYPYQNEIRTLCFLVWPDGYAGISKTDYWYNVIFLLVTYVIPMIVMAIAYSRMGAVLWGSASIGETTERQEMVIKSKQKIVKMLITIVTLFGACWLPYHVYFIYTYHYKDLLYTDYIQHVYLGIYWLAMSNSMYNPLVYYWMNARFRAYFELVLCCCWNKNICRRRPLNGQESKYYSTRTKSFRLSLSKSSSIRSFKERFVLRTVKFNSNKCYNKTCNPSPSK